MYIYTNIYARVCCVVVSAVISRVKIDSQDRLLVGREYENTIVVVVVVVTRTQHSLEKI